MKTWDKNEEIEQRANQKLLRHSIKIGFIL